MKEINLIEFGYLHIYAFVIAMVAYVYAEIITEPEMILSWIYKYLEDRLRPVFFKPLIGCLRCVSGQWALWVYFFINTEYNPFIHLYFICITIWMACLIYKLGIR